VLLVQGQSLPAYILPQVSYQIWRAGIPCARPGPPTSPGAGHAHGEGGDRSPGARPRRGWWRSVAL